MKYRDISPTMRMFIGNREGLRRLGFSADDLYAQPAMSARFRKLSGFLVLKTQGIEFKIECGLIKSEVAFRTEYEKTAAAINSGAISDDDFARMYEESEAFNHALSLLAALKAKGIRLPSEDVADLQREYKN